VFSAGATIAPPLSNARVGDARLGSMGDMKPPIQRAGGPARATRAPQRAMGNTPTPEQPPPA
jgi:hypothetical protein